MVSAEYITHLNTIAKHHWPKEIIKDIHEFEQGYNNVAFRVKTNKRTVVIKLIKRKDSEINAKHESWAFKKLKKKFPKLPTPTIITFNNEKKLVPYAYAIATLLKGKPLNTRLKQIKNYKSLFQQVGEIRGMIHSFKYKKYGAFDHNYNIVAEDKLDKTIEKTKEKLKRLQFPESYLEFWNKNSKLLYKDNKPCLCQGDAGQSNYLISDSNTNPKITGLLDFEFVRVARSMNDIITFYQEFEKIDQYLDAIELGYKKYATLPKQWKQMYYLYAFARFVNEIDKIDTFEFRNKTKAQMQKIRKVVKARCRVYLKICIANFSQ